MKRTLLFLLGFAVMISVLLTSVSAERMLPRLSDAAGLLTDEEFTEVTKFLDDMSEKHQFDFVIVTLAESNGEDPEELAWYIYESYGFGYGERRDGIILLICMDTRDWVITSVGNGQDSIDKSARDSIATAFLPSLSAGNYADAFKTFASMSEFFLENYDPASDDWDSDGSGNDRYNAAYDFPGSLIISFIISFIVGLISVGVMKSKLKSVRAASAAANYIVPGSLEITDAKERYLYSNVTRVAIPRDTTSSGGRSGGGGGHSMSTHSSSHGKF